MFLGSGLLPLLVVIGCSGVPDTLDPSSKHPVLGKSRPNRYSISSLVVSTDTWVDPNLGSGDDGAIVRPTGYALYDERGGLIQHVRNYIGALDREPTTLELNPGRYLIRLDKPGKHPPVFWVVVEPGKLTEVDLLH
jgi:hypothetical protein